MVLWINYSDFGVWIFWFADIYLFSILMYMIRFYAKLLLFTLPLALLLVFPGCVVYLSKEYLSSKEVVIEQINHPETLFGFGYNGVSFYGYKQELVAMRHSQIIALGTSRVMQFRQIMFKEPEMFTNAGGAGASVDDMYTFVQSLPKDTQVKVILLGIDQDKLYVPSIPHTEEERLKLLRFLKLTVTMSRKIYVDFFAHSYSLAEVIQTSQTTRNIGLSALVKGDGFRSDGSYQYTQAYNNSSLESGVSSQVEKQIVAIHTNVYQSEAVRNQLEKNLITLELLLSLCRTRGITVIGFSPPYPQALYNEMATSTGQYQDMVIETPQRLSILFQKYNFSFVNGSSPASFGGKDNEVIDAVHGTDAMYARLLVPLLSHSSGLKEYTNTSLLTKLLTNEHHGFLPQ
jgi:hypothetical protein